MAHYDIATSHHRLRVECRACGLNLGPLAPDFAEMATAIKAHEQSAHRLIKVSVEHSGDPDTALHVVCLLCGKDWLAPDSMAIREALTYHPHPCKDD